MLGGGDARNKTRACQLCANSVKGAVAVAWRPVSQLSVPAEYVPKPSPAFAVVHRQEPQPDAGLSATMR